MSTVRRVGGALAAGTVAAMIASIGLTAQTPARSFALETGEGLRLNNVAVQPATLDGKRGLRVRLSEDAQKRRQAMTPQQQEAAVKAGQVDEQLAVEFGDGVIEVEVAGSPRTEMFEDARGFVGIAFRLQPDLRTYDAFYLRPTNGRADDQVRRNHSVQYISHPDWPWARLRRETPEKYESYVDLVPGVWTKMRIEVRGTEGRLYVHGQPQPTLIVKDLKTGAAARGAVALWLDASTDAHFRYLVVTPAAGAAGPR
jgi:hypothetical protein